MKALAMTQAQNLVTAFAGTRRIAFGPLASVALEAKKIAEANQTGAVLIFDDATGKVIDVDFRGSDADIIARFTPIEPAQSPSRGRPKLGVVAREVTLLPRHWDWLANQPGGASAALRKLVEQARRENLAKDEARQARDALYRFVTAMAGDFPGYEEAIRALFADNASRFADLIREWPEDVRNHAARMAAPAFGTPPSVLDGVIPPDKLTAVERGLHTAFPAGTVLAATRVAGGASGAGVFKITVKSADYFLRIEGQRDAFRDPVRHYACLKIAAEAGIAPPLYYADPKDGIAITGFIRAAPMSGAATRLPAIVQAVKMLHAAPLFPPLLPYLDGVDMLIDQFRATHILPEATVAEHLGLYSRLAAAYPRHDTDLISSHNDLNPSNILFEGERVWIVDWESAFAADRYVDLAALANFFARDEAEEALILQHYFGDALTDYHRARFFLMQQVNRIFYAMVMLNGAAAARPEIRLKPAAMQTPRFHEVRGEMATLATLEGRIRFACVFLNEALHHMKTPRFSEAIELVGLAVSGHSV